MFYILFVFVVIFLNRRMRFLMRSCGKYNNKTSYQQLLTGNKNNTICCLPCKYSVFAQYITSVLLLFVAAVLYVSIFEKWSWPFRFTQYLLFTLQIFRFRSVYHIVFRDPELLNYTKHPQIVKRLAGYQVRMGIGIHCGWAIEGAIGSSYKIDATYLSPHVNLSSRLESGTKLYQVNPSFSSQVTIQNVASKW